MELLLGKLELQMKMIVDHVLLEHFVLIIQTSLFYVYQVRNFHLFLILPKRSFLIFCKKIHL